MVSISCKTIVKSEIEKLGLHCRHVELGYAEIEENINTEQKVQLQKALMTSGLVLIDNKKAILVDRIKTVVVEMIHYDDSLPKIKFSNYLSSKLDYDYTYLANLFSETTGITIEHYIIAHKIERVKELLEYNELNLTEISYKLSYSSVAHLSYQFKKVTGLTPSLFKHIEDKKRLTLDIV